MKNWREKGHMIRSKEKENFKGLGLDGLTLNKSESCINLSRPNPE
jgi:hypothetical protein